MFPLRLICLMFLSGISGEDFLASSRFELPKWNSSSPPYSDGIQVPNKVRFKASFVVTELVYRSVTVVPGPGISIPQPCFVSVSQLTANWHRPQDWVPPPEDSVGLFFVRLVVLVWRRSPSGGAVLFVFLSKSSPKSTRMLHSLSCHYQSES